MKKSAFLFSVAGLCLGLPLCLVAQQPLPLHQLILKGTHNSYACCGGQDLFGNWGNTCPVMHNPPFEQLDDWNVWAFELDFAVKILNGVPTVLVGHSGPNGEDSFSTSDWGTTLKNYLLSIKNTRSFVYRPTILYFNDKSSEWGENGYKLPNQWGPLLDALLLDVFETTEIYGQNAYLNNSSNWPTVPQLAGKVIPYTDGYSSSLIFSKGTGDYDALPSMNRWWKDDYTNPNERTQKATSGQYQIISCDQYQDNWAFDDVTPPNPVYIRSDAANTFEVTNQYGHDCFDLNDVGQTFQVTQHGTFRFPYDKIGESVNAAYPGWTLLIHTGTYHENMPMTITKPLTLKAEDGPVVIGN